MGPNFFPITVERNSRARKLVQVVFAKSHRVAKQVVSDDSRTVIIDSAPCCGNSKQTEHEWDTWDALSRVFAHQTTLWSLLPPLTMPRITFPTKKTLCFAIRLRKSTCFHFCKRHITIPACHLDTQRTCKSEHGPERHTYWRVTKPVLALPLTIPSLLDLRTFPSLLSSPHRISLV